MKVIEKVVRGSFAAACRTAGVGYGFVAVGFGVYGTGAELLYAGVLLWASVAWWALAEEHGL